jgi:4-hydroxybenzoate polyprenyltransferase
MSLRGVWRILRLPLFVTAVADVTAGYVIALAPGYERFDWSRLALVAGVSTGLYIFGMVQNDLVDLRRDRLLKVPRPLVTGELGIGAAVVLLVLTALLAGACAAPLQGGALVLTILTFAAINLYNLGGKHGPSYIAMISMGLCRLLNFGIGVTAAIGTPRELDLNLLLPSASTFWVRQGLALFFLAMIVTGYSISARRGNKVTTRVWQAAFIMSAVAGFVMIALSTMPAFGADGEVRFVAPVARVLAALLLPALWPGGLWSITGLERKPEEYEAFIPRALYWCIVMDAAFVLDRMIVG